ncbi:MAG: hypothetical protein GC150_03290 [Rhizobiales bacterium]|nr:hypothetical protein [Hyphomicrobiales bacterium]
MASTHQEPSDLELTSLIASVICHDVINPVGAIYNGLEVLDDDPDPESRNYALEVIRNFTSQASARLKFARFAFGAASSAGSVIDLREAAEAARGYLSDGKHEIDWALPPAQMPKDQVKLLLNLVAIAPTCLHHGGRITVAAAAGGRGFELTCVGKNPKPPKHLPVFLAGGPLPAIDAFNVQSYFTTRLARTTGMRLEVESGPEQVILRAIPA